MEYAKLKPDNTFDYQISGYENVVWDESHFCPPSALTSEEAAHFQVVPLIEVPIPPFDSKTHKCCRDGAEFVANEWRFKWTIVAVTAEELNQMFLFKQREAINKIHSDYNKIYADVIGNMTTEYLKAADDARAFKAAGYPANAVPESVQSWADAKLTWTAQQAADDILVQEAAWITAAELIRKYRLKAKEDVKRATTIAEIDAAMVIWNVFVSSIRTQLGVA